MPTKDPKYEFFRVRNRNPKEKEKDRDRDARSVAESSVTTIRDRKHRNSFTSNHGNSTETSTQASGATFQDMALDQLPALPENEESEGTSTATSPIVRTNSNVSNPTSRSSPPSVSTPARLQPYLESEADTSSVTAEVKPTTSLQEWIGPRVDTPSSFNDPLDSMTPTPRPKKDPLESAGNVLSNQGSDPHDQQQRSKDLSGEVDNQGRLIADTNAMVYSWAGSNKSHEQYYYPSEMANPFLPPEQNSLTVRKKSTTPEIIPNKPAAPEPPIRRSPPPARSNNRAQERTEPRSQPRAEYHPPIRVEVPLAMSNAPPMTEMSLTPGFGWPMVPAPSPIPMHHTQSNPLPYPSGPPRIDHPAHILHRIGSVLPDIGALMDLYQSTCGILIARDRHISDLQSQKAAEAENQNRRIERLTTEIESLLARHTSQVKKLKEEIGNLEHEHVSLQGELSQEKKLRDDARTTNTNLKAKYEEMKRKNQQRLEEMNSKFLVEVDELAARHTEEQRDITAKAKGVEANLSSQIAGLEQRHELDQQTIVAHQRKIADIEERHESERKANEDQWRRHIQDIEDNHTQVCRDMEITIESKEKALEEERRNHFNARDNWDKELEAVNGHWNEERNNLQKAAQDQQHALINMHQKETDDIRLSAKSALLRQEAESQDTILNLQRERDELQQSLDRTHTHYKLEIETAMNNFIEEKETYCQKTETAFSQQQAELHNTVHTLQQEKEALLRSRAPSQTRQPNELHLTIPNSQKDNETLRPGTPLDRCKTQKPTCAESTISRSSTPAPKEDRKKLHRVSGVYGSGACLKPKGAVSEQSNKACEPRKSEEGQRRQGREVQR